MSKNAFVYRGRDVQVLSSVHLQRGLSCIVQIDGINHTNIKAGRASTPAEWQSAGAGYARALIDSQLDGGAYEHSGYFIRTTSNQHNDGKWAGAYQLYLNDAESPFTRVACEPYRGDTAEEAKLHALERARTMIDIDIEDGKL